MNNSTKEFQGNDANAVLPAVFDLFDYLISKGFKKRSEPLGNQIDYYCQFTHPNWIGTITIWDEDDCLMAIGNSDDVEFPSSENEFIEKIIQSNQRELLVILNGR